MHKFTIFTILLSTVVVLVVADVVINDYWGEDFASEEALDESSLNEITAEVSPTEARGDETPNTDEGNADEPAANTEVPAELPASEAAPLLPGKITEEALALSGFLEVTLNTSPYDGLIYGFWDTLSAFADFTVLKHTLFNGSTYVATLYEVQAPTEISLFEAYQTLKTLASTSESGEINENDAYGEGSFYFNHSTKTNTVFLVFYKNGGVYAFEYGPSQHVAVRTLIEML